MISLKSSEFVPPIFYRTRNFLLKRLPFSNKIFSDNILFPPYDQIPFNNNVKWIIDIGANIGYLSENALLSYPNAKVVCFEPVNTTFDQLKTNLAKYGDRVYLKNLALSDENGTAEINITTSNGANSLAKQSDFHKNMNPTVREISKQTVSLKKLDDILNDLPSNHFEIVKIDVEGFEMNVLRGGVNFFKNCVDTVIIEVCFMRDTSIKQQSITEIFDFMRSSGFYLYNMYDFHHSNDQKAPFKLIQMDCVFKKHA